MKIVWFAIPVKMALLMCRMQWGSMGLNKIVEARILVSIGLVSLVGFKNQQISFTKVKLVEVVVQHRCCYV